MLLDDFRRIVSAFADSKADIDLERGTLLMHLRDEMIEARLSLRGGHLLVDEAGQPMEATSWLTKRVARVPLLADRILSYVDATVPFVTPAGRLLDQPDFAGAHDDVAVDDARKSAIQILNRQPAGTTSVLYLTSDAGEGKTTLIKELAIQQARDYKAGKTAWLLVPIPLGGRTFLRFDDIVVGALVNNLRFQLFYFEAFLEMVRLGVIVPAFDGFEEMIVEGSMGEAISALGNLVRSLHANGTLLLAVRKAYFEYRSFRTQAKLFDAVGSGPVAFARLALQRWTDSQFLAYGKARELQATTALHEAVSKRLGINHPLLTRAVLVRRLIDLAKAVPDLAALLATIDRHHEDYFYQFVYAIVEREAQEKWLDQASDPAQPLLTVEEHHDLLAMFAQELWTSNVDALRADVVAVLADMFADSINKPPVVARQIRERLRQHALLVPSKGGQSLAFDHEDFRVFFLGESLGRLLRSDDVAGLRSMLQLSVLPQGTVDSAARHLTRAVVDAAVVVTRLTTVAAEELPTSFVRVNCGALAIRLLDRVVTPNLVLKNMAFPSDALRGRTLAHLSIDDGYFEPTSLQDTDLSDCHFTRCRFERLEVDSKTTRVSALLDDCECGTLARLDRDDQLFDPSQIFQALMLYGFKVRVQGTEARADNLGAPDEETVLLERALRVFLRATQVNESVLKLKLGSRAPHFIDQVLPALLKAGVLEDIPYKGSGVERRFKVGVAMHHIQQALAASKGKFQSFLIEVQRVAS